MKFEGAIYQGGTTADQLEVEFAARWTTARPTRPLLFIWVRAALWPCTIRVLVRSWTRRTNIAERWAQVATTTLAAPEAGDAVLVRLFVGDSLTGVILQGSRAGDVVMTDEGQP